VKGSHFLQKSDIMCLMTAAMPLRRTRRLPLDWRWVD
jgi:hypothetical protein